MYDIGAQISMRLDLGDQVGGGDVDEVPGGERHLERVQRILGTPAESRRWLMVFLCF